MQKSDLARGPAYHLRLFRTGECRILGQYAYRTYARDRDHVFTIYIGIVQGNGLTALVDTGMTSVDQMNRGAGFLMSELIHQAPGEDTLSILSRAGLTPDQIDYVFLTHCHYDHCSNLTLFPNARAVIPQTAWQAWHADPQRAVYLHAGFLGFLEDLHAQDRLVLCDEGEILPGIGVRRVGGHSVCSQFIYVNTARGLVALTGDTVQMYANLEQDDPIHILDDEAEARAALQTARTTADLVIPGHDPRVLEVYPGGIIAKDSYSICYL